MTVLDTPPGQAPGGLAISSQGLTKRFRSGQVAVDGVDLAVPTGSVYGFLGPNGSGKTTTIRLLLGLLRPTGGSHRILGEAMPDRSASVLPRVGALVEGPAFHPYLSGVDNLRRIDAADRTVDPATAAARIEVALERVGLAHAAGKRYRHYSLGMRQRLGIAATLLRPRELLVLDEPTNGLDPQGTREVRALLLELAAAGTTVVLSTHLLSEVQQVCTHVGVMHRGRLVAQAPLDELAARSVARAAVRTPEPARASQVLAGLGVADVRVDGDAVSGDLRSLAPEAVVAALVHAGVPVRGFEVRSADLEEMFVELTGEGFDVSG
ncbi:ABC transporter ATP-binding protein [Cellulomonas aerilata]|uniref:ABC transporter ATP-binding protein n=1 Tax=Cellulomonas aerilata TaxID=515326 RepID=A0A512DCM2_9CELL|nr:ABC transporter ATP-binding protein [Cellulomonas aerilata]GEO34203.1 ABC transporter ATP-binding protein [Cellulomonas aerilata]